MAENLEEFEEEVRDAVQTLRRSICETARYLAIAQNEFTPEHCQQALALAICQSLLSPCDEHYVFDPRALPQWMDGIGRPTTSGP